jgi:hypothetical protein
MGFFSEEEAESLRLARMSLHIVTGDDEFEPQPELPVEHDDFLLDLIRDIASDSVYRFGDLSTTRDNVEAIARRDVSFEAGAQVLAGDFCRFHNRARDGAFFVFELAVNDESTSIYALMKYDYGEALELVKREGANGLRRIVEAFVHDKAAIQKAAIIRTVEGVAAPQVSTRDRMGRPAPLLTDFFLNYLQVVRDRSDQELTKDVKDVVRTILHDHRELLPPGGLAAGVSRALDVLRCSSEITESTIRQAVWVGAGQPSTDDTRQSLENSVNRLIRRKKLEGVAFPPDPGSLVRSVRRVVRTEEGVTLEYNTALDGQAVKRVDLDDGSTQFIVTTRKYTDGVIAERSGASRR